MNRQEKENEVGLLNDRIQGAKTVIFTSYIGLKVSEITQVRTKLRKEKANMKVIKNRLALRALQAQGLSEEVAKFISGPTAIATSEVDPVAPAKVIVEFAKQFEALKIRGGLLDGKLITAQDVQRLAALPSREELLAKMLGSMQAPAGNVARALSALPRQLVTVIDAIAKTKQ